jgi:hypothetical protein
MKKIGFTILALSMYIISTQAQIRVDQFGDVNIGVTTTNSIDNLGDLIIGQDGLDNSLSFYNSTGTSLRMYRMNDYGFIMRGRNIEGQTYNYKGIIIDANGNIGIKALPNSSYSLYVSGPAYSTGSWQGSDIRMKSNVKKISVQSHVYDSLTPISYNYKLKKVNKSGTDMGGYAQADADSIDTNTSFGFSAQEVQKYFPNLVQEDGQGFLAVNYDGFIPILWESHTEMLHRIQALEAEIENLTKNNGKNKLKSESITEETRATIQSSIVLYQNFPNPWNSSTTIAASIPASVTNAMVCIYDLTGKQLRCYHIAQRGEAQIVLHAEELQPGMYIYSLLADGKLIDSKQMVLTE